MTDLATLTVRLEAEIGKYQANLDKATRQLKSFQSGANSILSKGAAALSAFFTIGAAKQWGEQILENGDRLAKFSQTTGIAVENLSRIEYAMKASGIEGQQLGGIFKNLNASISEAAGNAKSAAAVGFNAMGISVRDTAGNLKKADTVLLEIATKFQGYADGANKSALATAYFGKAGDALIPFLNQGAEGIQKLAAESDRLGATWTGETAKAAEEFNDRLGRLKTSLFDGIGNRIAKDLLPTLNALGARWEETGRGAEVLDQVARTLAAGLRLLVTSGILVTNVFNAVGKAIGSSVAAIGQAVQGNFSEAGDILKDYWSDTVEQAQEGWKDIQATWEDGSTELLDDVKVTAEAMKREAPNLAGGVALQTAIDKAIDQLKKMSVQMRDQVATFGLSEAATIRYRLETGDLASVVKAAGAAGLEYAASIEAQADALQKLKDTKEIEDALAAVNVQIQQLKGNTAEAAIADFDKKNAELVTKLRQQGNVEGQKQLDQLLLLIVATEDFNELNQKAAAIQSQLASEEERLRNSREAGALTEIQYQRDLGALRVKAADDLAAIAEAQGKIAQSSGIPGQVAAVQQLTDGIANLRAQSDLLEKSIRNNAAGSFGTFLKDFVKDVHNAGQAFEKFLGDIADQILDLASQQLTQQLFQTLFGSTSSAGGSGGWLGNLFAAGASAFAGGKAAGGPVSAGLRYKVNEKTARSEWFVPDVPGRIVPHEEMMGGRIQVNQNFAIQAPTGSVSRGTQMQVAASAARGLGEANRRNN